MENNYKKIIPIPQGESEFYWNKALQGELWLRKCNECSHAYFYPRDISPCCFSRDTEWIQSSGRGIVYAFSIIHRSPNEGFQDEKTDVLKVGLEPTQGYPHSPSTDFTTRNGQQLGFFWHVFSLLKKP